MHYQRWRQSGDPTATTVIVGDDEARFWSHVGKNGPIPERRPDLGPCWVWTGAVDRKGYAIWWADGVKCVASRWAYGHFVGPVIPAELQADHLCFNTSCVNFETHLEPVTPQENNRRSTSPSAANVQKTHCTQGHEYDEANTYVIRTGGRRCRRCNADRETEQRLIRNSA
jgi:hypothetical protein